MDATRQFRMTVYFPLYSDGYDSDMPLTLEEAWKFWNENEHPQFVPADALSLETTCCILDFDNLTVNEYQDVWNAIN